MKLIIKLCLKKITKKYFIINISVLFIYKFVKVFVYVWTKNCKIFTKLLIELGFSFLVDNKSIET